MNVNKTWEDYSKKTHILGRILSVITLVMLLGAPFLIGSYLGAFPDMKAVGKGFLSVGIVWLVSSVAEFLIYTPDRYCRFNGETDHCRNSSKRRCGR